MNEEFQKYLMSILEKTGEFLSAEVPEIANQILKFSLAENIVWLLFYLISLTGLYFGLKFIFKTTKDKYDNELERGLSCILAFFIGSISAISTVDHMVEIFKITIAPKLFLLEYASNLVK